MVKLDYKKTEKQFYNPPKKPTIVDIPEMNFFMVDGQGDPGKAQSYKDALELLYKVSYTLKMKIVKKDNTENDYVVPPLQGLWYIDDMSKWSTTSRDKWQWTMMIRIPDHVSDDQIDRAIVSTVDAGFSTEKLRIERYHEGLAVQTMYIGSYLEEGPTIAALHRYAKEQGYKLHNKHH